MYICTSSTWREAFSLSNKNTSFKFPEVPHDFFLCQKIPGPLPFQHSPWKIETLRNPNQISKAWVQLQNGAVSGHTNWNFPHAWGSSEFNFSFFFSGENPLKTNILNPKQWRFGRWFSFSKGWFSGSMLLFGGYTGGFFSMIVYPLRDFFWIYWQFQRFVPQTNQQEMRLSLGISLLCYCWYFRNPESAPVYMAVGIPIVSAGWIIHNRCLAGIFVLINSMSSLYELYESFLHGTKGKNHDIVSLTWNATFPILPKITIFSKKLLMKFNS